MITQEYLKSNLHYDPETGAFTWLTTGKGRRLNREAGAINVNGYMQIAIDRALYYTHRLAWLYMAGELPNKQIDHINQIRNDNRFINLRIVTNLENSRNATMSKGNVSGFTGVVWVKGRNKWRAQICIDGKTKSLGCFIAKTDAIAARKSANLRYGFSERHGLADCKRIVI